MATKLPLRSSRPTTKGRAFWGPIFWDHLHIISVAYKPTANTAKAFKKFLEAEADLLPCPTCAIHFKENLIRYPPDQYMRNNHDLFFWTYFMHDLVNNQCNANKSDSTGVTNKPPKQSPPFETAKRYYFAGLGESCNVCDS